MNVTYNLHCCKYLLCFTCNCSHNIFKSILGPAFLLLPHNRYTNGKLVIIMSICSNIWWNLIQTPVKHDWLHSPIYTSNNNPKSPFAVHNNKADVNLRIRHPTSVSTFPCFSFKEIVLRGCSGANEGVWLYDDSLIIIHTTQKPLLLKLSSSLYTTLHQMKESVSMHQSLLDRS